MEGRRRRKTGEKEELERSVEDEVRKEKEEGEEEYRGAGEKGEDKERRE